MSRIEKKLTNHEKFRKINPKVAVQDLFTLEFIKQF